jgi:hypothetical protein
VRLVDFTGPMNESGSSERRWRWPQEIRISRETHRLAVASISGARPVGGDREMRSLCEQCGTGMNNELVKIATAGGLLGPRAKDNHRILGQ